LPEIDRQQAQGKEVAFRGDAAFAKPELYESVEKREAKYTIRLPVNDNLERKVAQLLTRPVGRPSYTPVVRYKSFLYQAASWTRARRGGSEDGVPLRGVVPAGGVYRDQLPDFKPGGRCAVESPLDSKSSSNLPFDKPWCRSDWERIENGSSGESRKFQLIRKIR